MDMSGFEDIVKQVTEFLLGDESYLSSDDVYGHAYQGAIDKHMRKIQIPFDEKIQTGILELERFSKELDYYEQTSPKTRQECENFIANNTLVPADIISDILDAIQRKSILELKEVLSDVGETESMEFYWNTVQYLQQGLPADAVSQNLQALNNDPAFWTHVYDMLQELALNYTHVRGEIEKAEEDPKFTYLSDEYKDNLPNKLKERQSEVEKRFSKVRNIMKKEKYFEKTKESEQFLIDLGD